MTQLNCGPSGQRTNEVGLTVSTDAERPDADTDLIEAARRIGANILGPNAQITDQGEGPNPANFQALAQAGLLGMGLPKEFGGKDASGATQRDITETLASYCGVTTFTQAQHHGPSRMIANGSNEAMKRFLLPDLSAGRQLCAVSFAHLRRPGPPVLQAEPINGGYRLNGTTPWVTGWGLMNQVVFGATLPDERFVFFWVPGDRSQFAELFDGIEPPDGDWGALTASAPLRLCAMNASATVELTCRDLFVPEAHRLSFSDRETMRRNDRNGVLGATPMPLGCAAGAIRLLCDTAERRGMSAIRHAASSFQHEWEDTRAEVLNWSARGGEADFFDHAVLLRARVLLLAVRAGHAAVVANSGGANTLAHPAQRYYREAMFYNIQAQTQEVMAATLELLVQT